MLDVNEGDFEPCWIRRPEMKGISDYLLLVCLGAARNASPKLLLKSARQGGRQGVRECLVNAFLVNILIRIHTNYEPIACIPPFLQLFDQIISKSPARTRSILLLCDEVAPMLLVACLGSFLIIIARIVSTDDASHYPF